MGLVWYIEVECGGFYVNEEEMESSRLTRTTQLGTIVAGGDLEGHIVADDALRGLEFLGIYVDCRDCRLNEEKVVV